MENMDFLKIYKINEAHKQPGKELSVAFLIPSFNEEKTVCRSIESILAQTIKPKQIIYVNDGSSDGTIAVLDQFGKDITIVDLGKNTGNKSYAQELGLWFVDADIMITGDADTIFHERFIEEIIISFNDEKVVAVSGYVESLKHNWLTACREIDYVIGQNIHKLAQSYMNFLMVIPGCAAAFRLDVFEKIVTFDHDTITEDMDFTYKINKSGYKIAYNRKAKVFTQDPANLSAYINQMKRWYGGGWQNLKKHYDVIKRPWAAFELSLGYIEGVVMPFLLLSILILNFRMFCIALALLVVYCFLMSVLAALISRRFSLVWYFFHYFIICFINSYIFLREFVNEIILNRSRKTWYHVERRTII